MSKLGHVQNLGIDASGHENRRRLDAIAECPRCGKEVECWADTEEWIKVGKQWRHSQYGGAIGVCEECHLLVADCLDRYRVFDLAGSAKPVFTRCQVCAAPLPGDDVMGVCERCAFDWQD